jgi:hypothetical protein
MVAQFCRKDQIFIVFKGNPVCITENEKASYQLDYRYSKERITQDGCMICPNTIKNSGTS